MGSITCPSLQSSSDITPKFARIVPAQILKYPEYFYTKISLPLLVTHLVLMGLSLSQARAALLLSLTWARCSALSDPALLIMC